MKLAPAIVGALATAFAVAPVCLASGPFLPRAVFVRADRPDSLEDFARGRLGVIRPTFRRSFLVVAYRHLAGVGLDSSEARAAVDLWRERIERRPADARPQEEALKEWDRVRRRVPGASATATLDATHPFDSRAFGSWWNHYVNCPPDAFRTAARTLEARIARYGAPSREVREWLAAQDSVFEACSREAGPPPEAPRSASAEVRADRDYQRAAWAFYRGDFEDAERRFDAIATDVRSPWRTFAPYLAARAVVRRAMLRPGTEHNPVARSGGAEGEGWDSLALARADERVARVLADPALAAMHEPARSLRGYIRFRRAPAERLHELAAEVSKPHAGAALRSSLCDYTLLLQRSLTDRGVENERGSDPPPAAVRADDVSDWVLTVADTSRAAAAHAFARWRERQTTPWLVAALISATPGDERLRPVVEASRRLRDSTARVWIVHARARWLSGSPRAEERETARRELERELSLARDLLDRSSRNVLLAARMALSRTIDDALRWAPRTAPYVSYGVDDEPWYVEEGPAARAVLGGDPRLDEDGARLLNLGAPLDTLARIVRTDALPAWLRTELAKSTWTRAVVLGRDDVALALAPVLSGRVPELRDDLARFRAAPHAAARRIEAVLTILRHPGLRPAVPAGIGRLAALGEIDGYRDNWWCSAAADTEYRFPPFPPNATGETPRWDVSSRSMRPPARSSRRDPRGERERLARLETAPVWLGMRVIAWARVHSDDPRAPEALHQVVRATRYGCANAPVGAVSREAWTLLHRRWPTSEWGKKTPYWYR